MNRKFLIVLFVTIFYNGVTNASPVNEHVSDGVLPEEKPPTASPVSTDHLNKKVESNSPATVLSVPAAQSTSAPLNHSEIPTADNTTTHLELNNKSTPAIAPVLNNKTSSVVNQGKNDTQRVDSKTPSVVNNGQNNTHPIDNKANQNSTAEVKNSPSSSEVHPALSSTPSPSTSTNKNSVASSTVAPTNPTTFKALNGTAVEVTTAAPISTVSEKVVVVHNTPAPAQENHFDGPSFIGGIVLTIGLTAIGFIAFKYYKSGKIDVNYRKF